MDTLDLFTTSIGDIISFSLEDYNGSSYIEGTIYSKKPLILSIDINKSSIEMENFETFISDYDIDDSEDNIYKFNINDINNAEDINTINIEYKTQLTILKEEYWFYFEKYSLEFEVFGNEKNIKNISPESIIDSSYFEKNKKEVLEDYARMIQLHTISYNKES